MTPPPNPETPSGQNKGTDEVWDSSEIPDDTNFTVDDLVDPADIQSGLDTPHHVKSLDINADKLDGLGLEVGSVYKMNNPSAIENLADYPYQVLGYDPEQSKVVVHDVDTGLPPNIYTIVGDPDEAGLVKIIGPETTPEKTDTEPDNKSLADLNLDDFDDSTVDGITTDFELNDKQDRRLKALLAEANQAETNGDIDTAIEKLREYEEKYEKIKKETLAEKREALARQFVDNPRMLFAALPRISGFDQEDIISPDDLSEVFPGYEADYDDLEIQSSPEELLRIIESAQELQEKADVNFKLVVRPDMTAADMAERVEDTFRSNGWDGPVYNDHKEDNFYQNQTPNEHELALISTEMLDFSLGKDILEQTQALIDFVTEHDLGLGVEKELESAAEEFASNKDRIERLISDGGDKPVLDEIMSLEAYNLLRPSVADFVADYISVAAKTDGQEKLAPNGYCDLASQWDNGWLVHVKVDRDGVNLNKTKEPGFSISNAGTNLSIRL
jgi:hypothetical protein